MLKRIYLLIIFLTCAGAAAHAAPYNLDGFVEVVPQWMEQFKAQDRAGSYSFLPGQSRPDLYGSTDMFYLLYSLDMLELSDDDIKSWAGVIRKFQDKNTGWFIERATLHPREHATAYAVGALTLLGAPTKYPLKFKENYDTQEELYDLLENIPWEGIWSASHIPTGIAASFINTGQADDEWLGWFFDWLDREADPATGYWIRGGARDKDAFAKEEMGGAFHFYFIYAFQGRPLMYPEKIIDATLSLQHDNGLWDADLPYCIDLDGAYNMILASQQLGDSYRYDDIMASLDRAAAAITSRLNDPHFVMERYEESHKLVGAVAALAEIQAFAPELLQTPKPLKSVLSASPFI